MSGKITKRSLKDTICVGNLEVQQIIESINDKIKTGDKINLVCYVYDDKCKSHRALPELDGEGVLRPHQESPDRVTKINGALGITGLTNLIIHGGSIPLKRSDILKVHTKEYAHIVEHICKLNKPGRLPEPSTEISINDFSSIESIFAAMASVMGAVNLVCSDCHISTNAIAKLYKDKKMTPPKYRTNVPTRAFCNVRPPGHHAHPDHGAGFCFMNNIAVGAKYALDKYPDTIKKIFIFDWDLHHGNGTQRIFGQECSILDCEDRSQIMYASIHRGKNLSHTSEETDFYPFTGTLQDNLNHTNVFNVPLKHGATIEQYKKGFGDVLRKAIAYNPDLIMISAGFDSHKDDLYGELPLDYRDYVYMTEKLIDLANKCAGGRIISVLEGGYTIDVLMRSVLVHIGTMITYD